MLLKYCFIVHHSGLVCTYILVESIPLLACGLFHEAPIHDVTSFHESYALVPPSEING